MKYEALESFSGIISMSVGEVREIPNEKLAKDLMKAKLIKKYIASDTKALKQELENANTIIDELNNKIAELTAELETLRNANDGSDDGATSDDEGGSDDGDTSDKGEKK